MTSDVSRITAENKENRVARVFVSSTFCDMKDEREYLADTVFPRIKRQCREIGVEFVPIDLRWGITDEQAKQGKTLEICLREIDHARPFFIGILGDNYGTPISQLPGKPGDAFKSDYPRVAEYLKEDVGVTEAEIRHGVFDVSDKVDAHFWFRASSAEQPDERLQALKERIQQSGYPVDVFSSPQNLGEQVEEALIKWINDVWSEERELTWLERQNLEQSAFERSRSRLYIPNQDDFDRLNAFVDSTDSKSNVLAVTGASGLGKSSLLINWAKKYRESHPDAFVLTHYVSASESSDLPNNILRRLTDTLKLLSIRKNDGDYSEELGQRKSLENMGKELARAVSVLINSHPGAPLVIILDGLNQLSEYDSAKDLAWLPKLSDKARVIVSTIDSDETLDSIKRRHWLIFEVQPLTSMQKSRIVDDILNDRGRTLNPEQIAKIVSSDLTSNPLALSVILEELFCLGDFTRLDSEIDCFLASPSIEELLEEVLMRIEKRLAWLNETSDRDEIVPTLASLIAVSRYGLTEEELQKIIGCNPLVVSTFWSVLDAHLVDRSGRFSYSHDYIRNAIAKRYATLLTKSRKRLIDSSNDVLKDNFKHRCQEVPWQLKELADWENLYKFLLDWDVFDELYNETLTCDFCLYWNELLRLKTERFKFVSYIDLDNSRFDDEKKGRLWHKLGYVASDFKFHDICEKAYDKALTVYRGLANESSEIYDFYIANILNNLGNLHCDSKDYSKAQLELEESLERYRILAEKKPNAYIPYVASTLNNLGLLLFDLLYYHEAESAFKDSLSLYRQLADSSHETFDFYVAGLKEHLGTLYTATGDYEQAERELQDSLRISSDMLARFPDVYNSKIANTLLNLGVLHYEMGSVESFSQAETELVRSRELYLTLAMDSPRFYKHHFATVMLALGKLHRDMGPVYYGLAFNELQRSYLLYRDLALTSPSIYCSDFAMTLLNLGLFHFETAEYEKSNTAFEDSLAIYRNLAKKNPRVYISQVAQVLSYRGALHFTVGSQRQDEESEFILAETNFMESLRLYHYLEELFPDEYKSHIAETLHNLGAVHFGIGSEYYLQGIEELEQSLVIRRELDLRNPDNNNSAILGSLFILAGLYHRTKQPALELERLLEYVERYQKLPVSVQEALAEQFTITEKRIVNIQELE